MHSMSAYLHWFRVKDNDCIRIGKHNESNWYIPGDSAIV
jgi:hypothetical protein